MATDMEDMVPTPIPTTARDLLMLSLRLMPRLTLPFSTAPTDIPMLVPMPVPMVPTPLLTDMDTEPMEPTPILTTERGLLMLSLRLMPTMVLMATVSPMLVSMVDTDTEPMVPTLMVTEFMASKMSPASV